MSANAKQRTTDDVISSPGRASSWRCGDIGGEVAVGDAGGDELLAAAAAGGAEASGAEASAPDAAAASASLLAGAASLLAAAGSGSFLGVSSLSNQRNKATNTTQHCHYYQHRTSSFCTFAK